MDEKQDPVAALENIPINSQAQEVQNYKLALSSKILNAEKLLMMYQFKDKAFHGTTQFSKHMVTPAWIKPQIELTTQFISATKRIVEQCDKPTFNSSNILDYLESLYAFREEQKRINDLDKGTNPMGPMTTAQIECIHLCTALLRGLNIVDFPDEEQLPPPPASS